MRSLKSNHLIKNGDPNLSSFVGRSQHPTPRRGRRIRPPPLLSTAASVVCARSTACSAIMAAFRDNLPPPRMYHPRIDAPPIPPVFQNRPQSEPSFRAPAPTANTPPVNMFRPIQAAALAHQHRPKSALPFRTAPLLVISAEQSGSIHNPRPRSPVFGSPAPQLRFSPSSPTLAAPFNAHVPRPQPLPAQCSSRHRYAQPPCSSARMAAASLLPGDGLSSRKAPLGSVGIIVCVCMTRTPHSTLKLTRTL
jgi:hypothetical protein